MVVECFDIHFKIHCFVTPLSTTEYIVFSQLYYCLLDAFEHLHDSVFIAIK